MNAPTSVELEASIASLRAEISAAEAQAVEANAAIDEQLVAGNKTALAAARKRLKAAQDRASELNDDLARMRLALGRAKAAEEQAQEQQQYDAFASQSSDLLNEATSITDALHALADRIRQFDQQRLAVYAAAPWKPNTIELASPLFSGPASARYIELELHIATEGLMCARFGQSPFVLAQSPRFVARLRENVNRVLSHRPHAQSDRPPAA